MARGYTGQFGHILNAPYVWLPLCAIFLLGLLDFHRLGRMAHLDLIALLGFGVSHFYFNRGEIGVSAPLAYIPLVYLLAFVVVGATAWLLHGAVLPSLVASADVSASALRWRLVLVPASVGALALALLTLGRALALGVAVLQQVYPRFLV